MLLPHPVAFSIATNIAYVTALYFGTGSALIVFYPKVFRFFLQEQPRSMELGPATHWYGWLATSFIAGYFLSILVPRKFSDRLWPELIWVTPIAALIATFAIESRYFLE